MLGRSYYSNSIPTFLSDPDETIFGLLSKHHPHSLEISQSNAWLEQIKILKDQFSSFENGHLLFEYSIPRMGKRVDNILLFNGIIYVLEFKVGEKHYPRHALEQVLDYALDLKNFHEQSHHEKIVPILVSSDAPDFQNRIVHHDDLIFEPLRTNQYNLAQTILSVASIYQNGQLDTEAWQRSIYKPTPTIIEAAQALYKGHSVQEISRSDSGAINLSRTSDAISKLLIIQKNIIANLSALLLEFQARVKH